MPEAITEPVHATAVAGRQDLAGLVDVRDVGERLVPQAALANYGGAGPRVELAVKALREVELFCVGEWLIAEDEHGVLVHPLANLTERLAIMDPAKVDGADLGDELQVKLSEFYRHRSRDSVGENEVRQQQRASVALIEPNANRPHLTQVDADEQTQRNTNRVQHHLRDCADLSRRIIERF